MVIFIKGDCHRYRFSGNYIKFYEKCVFVKGGILGPVVREGRTFEEKINFETKLETQLFSAMYMKFTLFYPP